MNTPWDQIIADLKSQDLKLAGRAFQALARLADQSRLPELYDLLQDDNSFVREAAAGPLAQLAGMEALPALFGALNQGEQAGQDNDLLCHAVQRVLEENQPKAAPFLLEKLADPSSRVRANAAWAMETVASQVSAGPLLQALEDKEPRVRSAAAGALGQFGDSPAVLDALLQALQEDDDEQVRVSAASSLGDLGDERAISALEEVRWDPAVRVRMAVNYALDRLRDEPASGQSRLKRTLLKMVERFKR